MQTQKPLMGLCPIGKFVFSNEDAVRYKQLLRQKLNHWQIPCVDLEDVLEDGLACGLHRIERLMRQNALRARPKRRRTPKDDGERSVIADNILDRDFQADRPNQKWLPDFTRSN